MNLAQAKSVVRLLQDVAHPRTCPITGQFYTPKEYAEFDDPSVSIRGYDRERSGHDDPEMMEFGLHVDNREVALYCSPDGRLWRWSSIQIPADDFDCECPGPPESKVDRSGCPVHGDSVREIDCFRRVRSLGWEVEVVASVQTSVRESTRVEDRIGGFDVPVGAPSVRRWRYVVHEGSPIRDVLAEYRAAKASA